MIGRLEPETVAIILGASNWPRSPGWKDSDSFRNAAAGIFEYFSVGLGVGERRILNLFDDQRSVADIDYEIDLFLQDAISQFDGEIKNLFLYYTGHGAFTEGDHRYCLALQSTRLSALGVSAYRMASLAGTLNRRAPHARRFIIIDACFAAAAQGEFMPQSDAASRMEAQTADVLAESGTALLCAASSDSVALAPAAGEHTMFSGALLRTLLQGSLAHEDLLSFDDIRHLCTDFIRETFRHEAIFPEIHIPDQRRGDISKERIFPNGIELTASASAPGMLDASAGDGPAEGDPPLHLTVTESERPDRITFDLTDRLPPSDATYLRELAVQTIDDGTSDKEGQNVRVDVVRKFRNTILIAFLAVVLMIIGLVMIAVQST